MDNRPRDPSLSKLQNLISSLNEAYYIDNKEKALDNIQELWKKIDADGKRVTTVLSGNRLISVFASVMEAKAIEWRRVIPSWVEWLFFCFRKERDAESEVYPTAQVQELFKVFKSYILAGNTKCLTFMMHIAVLNSFRQLLIQDDELYNALAHTHSEWRFAFFNTLTGSFECKRKVLYDSEFVRDILASPDHSMKWILLINIAGHPDAKTVLPIKQIISEVLSTSFSRRLELCALLCNESDLKDIELSVEWLELMENMLRRLIYEGKFVIDNMSVSLLQPILALVNLSTVDSQKENFGKRFVKLLKQIVTDEIPKTESTTVFLERSRQDAAKALWNLSYIEANRKLLAEGNGLELLSNLHAKTTDPNLKQNLNGILHMFISTPIAPVSPNSETKRGHVMISYNWGNQSIIKNIAQSLKAHGYNVWLDIEQMNGSTLEAMAQAIEQSETVLMCMSQRYKDSPNCRLEGEYCVNRKVRYIPLMMQKGYRPDGWLGIALGSKLYYEFLDEDNWDTKMTELVKAIGESGKLGSSLIKTTSVLPVATPAPPQPPKAVKWTDEELRLWMESEGIEQYFDLFKNHKYGRRELLELQEHYLPHPNFFFNLWKEAGITEHGDIFAISAAIRNLK